MAAWVYDCRDVRVYVWEVRRVMSLLLSLGYIPRGLGVNEGEHHICKRNDHHHRPELGAVKRHIHKSSGRSAHRCKRKNSRHRVSQANMRRQKVSDTAIYTGTAKGTAHRTKRHSYSQRHRQKGSRP